MKLSKLSLALALGLALLPVGVLQAERSPIFGSATVQAMSPEAARDVTARGYWADYYGGLSVTFAYNAYIYSYYARYFAVSNSTNEQSWYGTASLNAYYAYLYSAWAQTYSTLRM